MGESSKECRCIASKYSKLHKFLHVGAGVPTSSYLNSSLVQLGRIHVPFLKEVKVDEELRTKISKPLRMNFQGDNDTEDEFADVMNDLENLQAS